uniref:Uncharacterized protein n=1 Tax=Tanacetum cinerariifolium TaxID=118510 RepID=A0A6L2NRB5_TANCI|nr:hypothetical protein [Tanacetum cinerariifolium]
MPPKCDLRLIDEHFESVSVDVTSNIAPSDVVTVKTVDVNHKGIDGLSTKLSDRVLDLEKIKTAQAKETVDLKKKVKKNAKKEKVQNSKDEFIQDCQVSDKDKPGLGYKAASPAVEGFVNSFKMELHAPKHDLRLIDKHFESVSMDVTSNIAPSDVKTINTVDVNHKGVFSTKEPKLVMKNSFSPLIIDDWHSDDEGIDGLSTKLSNRVLDLEKIKAAQAKEIADLKKRVKKIGKKEKVQNYRDIWPIHLQVPQVLHAQILRYKAAYPAVEGFVNSSEMLVNQENVESILDKGYHEVPPPLIGNYMPPKHDLRLINEHFESVSVDVTSNIAYSDVKIVKNVDVNFKGVFSTEEPKPIMKNSFSLLLIKDWHSDDESEVEISPIIKVKIVKPSIDKIKFVKTARETVKNKESPKQHKHHPRGNKRNWNNIMSQRLGMWNNTRRVNHQNFANKFTHLHPQRVFVPQAVLTRSGKINIAGESVTTAVRPVNTAGSKSTMNHPRLISKAFKRGHSLDIRPFNKVLDLEKIKTDQAKEIADLKKRVKKTGKKEKRLIFDKSDFDVQAMMDADYELTARIRAKEHSRRP